VKIANILALGVMLASCSPDGLKEAKRDPAPPQVLEMPVASGDLDSKELGDWTLLMMTIVGYQGSPVKRNALARDIVSTAKDVFNRQDQRLQFVVMVAIESKFDENARSPAGAIGLTQVMPQYAREFGKNCGLNELKDSDLIYPDINLVLGACRFRELLEAFNGQPVPALVAYNAGLASNQLKQLQGLRNISNEETSNYVVRWTYLKDLAEAEKARAKKGK
jgi:membrane-bound lytic murein transglycosylase MltF